MCAEKFMAKFLPSTKIIKLRKNLTLFIQADSKTLYKAYERYSKILNLCPNHGYVEYVILHIFYHGNNEESKSILDFSAGGHFMSLALEEGREHIETIVSTHEQWNIEEPAKPTGKIYHVEDMEEFKKVIKKVNLLNKLSMKNCTYLVFISRTTNFKKQ